MECAFSGGADSTALIVLAAAAGLTVRAHHVDHGHRSGTVDEAERAAEIAETVGAEFVLHHAALVDRPNFEDAARRARRRLLGANVMTGHTADDLAETLLYRLLRGTGPDGLAAMRPGPQHPILRLRRADTEAICDAAGVVPIDDPSNTDPRFARNRIRAELLPLAASIVDRDVVPLLVRTAELASEQRDLFDRWCRDFDPSDAVQLAELPLPLARQVIRRWLADYHRDGYTPDLAAVDRVLSVARGDASACEVAGGLRVERSQQRLRIAGTTTKPQR